MHNAIDNGIESSRILRNQIKTLCHHGMLKMWIHLVRNIKNKKEEFNCVMMKNIKLFENFDLGKL
jgi:hypothetical protein